MMKSTNNKLSRLIFIDDVRRTHDVHQTPHKAFDLAAIKLRRIFTFALKLIAII